MNPLKQVIEKFMAENLLGDTFLFTQITDLRKRIGYQTDGQSVSFDNHFLFLQKQVEKVPHIRLSDAIPNGSESRYENELIGALEAIQDEVERCEMLATSFVDKLLSAKMEVEELASAFEAWYMLSANALLKTEGLELPQRNLKGLAVSEFNRLMNHENIGLNAVINAAKLLLRHLITKRSMAKQKFEMGQGQINASWANRIPTNQGAPQIPAFGVLEEEEYDDAPTAKSICVSRVTGEVVSPPAAQVTKTNTGSEFVGSGTVTKFPTISAERMAAANAINHFTESEPELRDARMPAPQSTIVELKEKEFHDGTELPSSCSICGEALEMTRLGPVCTNRGGHEVNALLEALPVEEEPVIKGTFKKTGDAVPVTVVADGDTVVKPGVIERFIGMDVGLERDTTVASIVIVENGKITNVEHLGEVGSVNDVVSLAMLHDAKPIPSFEEGTSAPTPKVVEQDYDDAPGADTEESSTLRESIIASVATSEFDDPDEQLSIPAPVVEPVAEVKAVVVAEPVQENIPLAKTVTRRSGRDLRFDFDDDSLM